MKVWIDTDSGTWGNVNSLVIVDLAAQAPASEDDVVDFLGNASDSEISEFGAAHGAGVIV